MPTWMPVNACAPSVPHSGWASVFSFAARSGPATGWIARAQRLLEHEEHECAERGYLLLPVVEQHLAAGDLEAAYATAAEAAEIGERCGDADLIACTRHDQGRIRIQQGQVEKGLALLDEVMVAVTAGELSSLVTGLMYCSVIQACQEVYAFGRAREWTAALAQWCEEQPEMVAFTGVCRVHRAEIMQLRGAWQEAIEEAQRARERAQGISRQTAAAALYQQAEVHRLRGEFAAAEEAYRSASQWGLEPQPGLALLRLAQGRTDAAVAAIRRAVSATADRLQRTKLLPAYIEIMLGRRRRPGSACRLPRAGGDRGELRYRRAGRDGRARPRGGRTGRRRRSRRARLAAPCFRGMAADRGAVRGGTRARADRAGLPGAGGRRRRRAGAGGGEGGVRAAGRRAGPRPHRRRSPEARHRAVPMG